MTTYFSVDVETTGLDYRAHDLLSVGIAVVQDLEIVDSDHWTIDHGRSLHWDLNTKEWWNEFPKQLELATTGFNSVYEAAESIREFVVDYEEDEAERIFVANPAVFDWQWFDYMFYHASVRNPFSRDTGVDTRLLDLRTAVWSFNPSLSFKQSRSEWKEFEVKPSLPHYALSDATAQAMELIKVLETRNARA